MNAPEWLKPGIYAAVVGATALAIIGFTWGGWMTGGDAKNMASDQSRMAVVAALVPICIEQSKQDPEAAATLLTGLELVAPLQRRRASKPACTRRRMRAVRFTALAMRPEDIAVPRRRPVAASVPKSCSALTKRTGTLACSSRRCTSRAAEEEARRIADVTLTEE